MSLRREVQELEYEEVLGMDYSSTEATVPRGFVRDAWNANPGLSGGWEKRKGYESQLDSAWTGRSITAGIEYKTPSNAIREVVFGTTGLAAGGTIGFNNAGTISTILGSLSGTARGFFVQLGNLLGYFNGVDAPVIYDGTTTRQMGITRPTTAPAFVSASAAGSLVPLSSYSWAYTFYNSVTGAESTPSDLLTYALTGGNDEVSFTVEAGDSNTADTVRIYRTYANGNQLFLEQEQTIGTTAISSTLSDDSLTTALEIDNSRVTDFAGSENAKFPCLAANRLFLATGENEIRHSKIGQSGPMFESFEVSAKVDTKGTYGNRDTLVGIGHAGDVPIVLKDSSFGRLEPTGLPDSTLPTDKVRYLYTEMSDNVGAVCHAAQCEVLGELLWLAKDNIYATDGRQFRAVATPISSFLRTCGYLTTQTSRISAVNDTRNQRVIFSLFVDGLATHPVYQVVGDYRKYPTFRWSIYRPGTNTTTHPGIPVGCLYTLRNTSDKQIEVRVGNCLSNGKLYQLNTGYNDDGSAIHFRLKTRAYSFGQPMHMKLFKQAEGQAIGDGNNYSLTMSSIYDLTDVLEDPQVFSLAATGDVWDTGIWDTSTWSSGLLTMIEYQPHRKAKFQQLVFEQASSDAPVEILSWGTLGSLF